MLVGRGGAVSKIAPPVDTREEEDSFVVAVLVAVEDMPAAVVTGRGRTAEYAVAAMAARARVEICMLKGTVAGVYMGV